jgi:hypothetical protein
MSVDYRGLINSSDDPMLQLVIELQKKLAKRIKDDAIAQLETESEDIYADGQDVDSVVKYHSELSGQHQFLFQLAYFPPFEPDFNQVKMMLYGTSLGNAILDRSGFNRTATIHGDPILVDGTIDLGYQTHGVKSIAMRMNRPTSSFENAEWLHVADSDGISVINQTVGTSVFVRVRLFSLADQGGRAPTIFAKIDDSTPDNGIMLQAKSDGKLLFIIKRGGTTVAKETAVGTVTTNVVYGIWVTFTVSGSVAHIYVDGIDKTLTTFGGTVNWQETLTDHSFFIFRRGVGQTEGFVYGDFYSLLYYRNRVITQTEVTRENINKWSISDIPFGRVMLAGYWATFFGGGEIFAKSFTSASFTSASFEV